MSEKTTRAALTLADRDPATVTEKDRDVKRLADLGLAGFGGDKNSEQPGEAAHYDDSDYASGEEIAMSEKDRDSRFSFVSPTDADFEDGEPVLLGREPVAADHQPDVDAQIDSGLAALHAELDEPMPEIVVDGPDEPEEKAFAEVKESVRAFEYTRSGPFMSPVILHPPADEVPRADGGRLTAIESPLAGNIQLNVAYAKAAMLNSLARGEAPFASHLLYAQDGIFDDADPIERGRGIIAGLAWNAFADRCAVYTDLGISSGMGLGIANAQALGIKIEWRTLGEDIVRFLIKTHGEP